MKSNNDNFEPVKGEPSMDVDSKSPKKTIIDKVKSLPPWIIVSLIALIFLVLFCVIPIIIIEVSNQWCNLFSGFFNAITPGICL